VYSSPLQTYESVDKKTMSGRETEAAVLTKAARKLKDCQNSWDANDRDEKLSEAFKFNQLVWSIFQGELKKEDNPLNRKLRADLLRLSAFVDRRIFETLAEPSPEKLNIVININNNIAAGLREGLTNNP
jgi:flagellar protein FlaF